MLTGTLFFIAIIAGLVLKFGGETVFLAGLALITILSAILLFLPPIQTLVP